MSFDQILARDKHLSHKLTQRVNGRFSHSLAWIMARTGDSLFWLAAIGILLWRKQSLGWDLLLTVVVTAVLVVILKGIFRRKRPQETWAIAADKYSFPSGHAARATAVAITLAFDRPSFTLLWLAWAVLVALARVALSKHFLSDVGGGLVVGVLIGLLLNLFV